MTTIPINDNRIGFRKKESDGNYRIVQLPTTYASGGYWNKQSASSPTTVYFGEDMQFFYVLPVSMPRLDDKSRLILENIVSVFASPKIVNDISTTVASDEKNEPVTSKRVRKKTL